MDKKYGWMFLYKQRIYPIFRKVHQSGYTEVTFLDKIKDSLRRCKSFAFSVGFIKKAGLVLLFKDIETAVERGAQGRIITSTYIGLLMLI